MFDIRGIFWPRVVIHHVQRYGCDVVLNFLAEGQVKNDVKLFVVSKEH